MITLYSGLTILLVIVSLLLIGLVLMQKGKGADAGAAFGSGASGTVFGARGSTNFLSRSTSLLATVFFVLCLGLAYLSAQQTEGGGSLLDDVTDQAPATSEPAAAPAPVDDMELDIPEDDALAPAALDIPEAGATPVDLPPADAVIEDEAEN